MIIDGEGTHWIEGKLTNCNQFGNNPSHIRLSINNIGMTILKDVTLLSNLLESLNGAFKELVKLLWIGKVTGVLVGVTSENQNHGICVKYFESKGWHSVASWASKKAEDKHIVYHTYRGRIDIDLNCLGVVWVLDQDLASPIEIKDVKYDLRFTTNPAVELRRRIQNSNDNI